MYQYILELSIIVCLAGRLSAEPENGITSYISSSPVFEVLWDEGENKVLVGARNQIINLNENMTLYQDVSTGPSLDNINCLPVPLHCDHARSETDNDVKVMLFIGPTAILVCGTLYQGMCHIYSNHNLSTRPIGVGSPNDKGSYVAGRDSVVSFISPCPEVDKCLYSARSFDDRPDSLTDYTLSSKIFVAGEGPSKRNTMSFEYAYQSETAITALTFTSTFKSSSRVKYIYGFRHEGYGYFLKTQRLNHDQFETRLGRVCDSDEKFFSYTEVTLRCMKESTLSYGLATTAYLGDISQTLQVARNLEKEEKVLYIVFGRATHGEVSQDSQGSVLCMFPMSQINSSFVNATRDCFKGGPRTRRLQSLLGTDTRCEKKNLHDDEELSEVLCDPGSNHYIEGQETVPGGVRASLKEVGTSLAVALQNRGTVAFVGTRNGNILKFVLERNEEEYSPMYNVSVTGPEDSFGTDDVSLSIRRSNAFDDKQQNLYFLTGNKVVKFPVASCSPYPDCRSCVTRPDPLSCGWCEDRCSTKAECKGTFKNNSCPPFIYKVSPLTGHVNGGTMVVIEGDNFSSFPQSGEKTTLNVTVAGVTCAIVKWRYKRITCRTNKGVDLASGPVVVDVTDISLKFNLDINGTAVSSENFTFLSPKLLGVSPWFGPVSGGTNVTILGENLDIGSNQTASLAGVDCPITQNNGTNIECTSSPNAQENTEEGFRLSPGSVLVWIDSNGVAPEDATSESQYEALRDRFEYREDPVVNHVRPNATSFGGGTKLIVTGRNLDNVAYPRLLVTITEPLTGKQHDVVTNCSPGVPKGFRLFCTTPSLVNEPLESLPTMKAPIRTYVSFIMDEVAQPRRFSHEHPEMSQLFYYPDPVFYPFAKNLSKVRVDTLQVVIKGMNLNLALQPEDVSVTVNGTMNCNVTELTLDTLRCSLSHLNSTLLRFFGKQHACPVTVTAGNLHTYVGDIILVEPPQGLSGGAVAGIAISVSLLLAILIVILYRKGLFKRLPWKKHPHSQHGVEYRADPGVPRNEYQDYPSGGRRSTDGACASPLVPAFEGPTINEETMDLLRADNILFVRDYLTLENEIGQGHFGRVYKGELTLPEKESRGVAVKTLHNCKYQSAESVESFLQEGLMMKDFHHHHVLTLIGVCFEDTGLPMVILPFMMHGDLRSYIQDETNEPTIKILMEFGIQVAEGMKYLSELKFVHRDLAARNCMLDEDMTVKVADFGLSRDVYERDYYSSDNKKSKLPVKWMAPESLEKGTYSTKSDVWAFGVVLWELMTRGVTPYPEVGNWEILNFIKTGRRMLQPSFCPDMLYRLMLRCWNEDPRKRPTFVELADETRTIIKQMENKNKKVGLNVTYVNCPVEGEEATTSSATVSFI